MQPPGTSVFRSKVDLWLAAVLVCTAAFSIFVTVLVLAIGLYQSGLVALLFTPLLLPIGAVSAGLPLWLLRSTRYELTATQLRVFSGPFYWAIGLHEIERVARSSSVLSSPALSLRRLRVEYRGGRSVLISPEDEDAFLRELEVRRAAAAHRVEARNPAPVAGAR